VRLPTASLEKFVAEFNSLVPSAHRKIDTMDVRHMTDCGLIGRYGYYGRQDIEIVRAILQYEQLRQNRQKRDEIRDADGTIHCRRCGVKLAPEPDNKRGRPHEFCDKCESFRARERWSKWRNRKVKSLSVH
jgi:hypothetical protein